MLDDSSMTRGNKKGKVRDQVRGKAKDISESSDGVKERGRNESSTAKKTSAKGEARDLRDLRKHAKARLLCECEIIYRE
jgi:hypothetical protein